MASAARAAWSEQTAQTPPPRRRACDPDQPTIIPRNPNVDLALRGPLRNTLAILLSKTSGLNRHLVWASDKRIAEWTRKSTKTVEKHLHDLEKAERIKRYDGEQEVMGYFMNVAAQFGARFSQPPASLLEKHRMRLIVILAWEPSVTRPGAYGPLGLKPPPSDESSETLKNEGHIPPKDEGLEPSLLRVSIEKGISLEEEIPLKSSSTTGGEAAPETTTAPDSSGDPDAGDDDGIPAQEDREAMRAELLTLLQADPRNPALVSALRRHDNPPPPEPRRRSTWVESTAAGHESDPKPARESPGARQGDRGRSEAESIARMVAGLTMTPQAGGKALADALGDDKQETLDTYRAGLSALADGRVSLEEMLGVIAEEFRPAVDHPNWKLSKFFAQARRRVKKPAAGSTRQSAPGGGPYPV